MTNSTEEYSSRPEPVAAPLTVDETFRRGFERSPDGDAVVHVPSNVRLTWRQLDAEVDAVARGLMALGIQKGERIALYGLTLPKWLTMFFAIARIGAVVVTINTGSQPAELAYVLEKSACPTLCIVSGPKDEAFLATTAGAVGCEDKDALAAPVNAETGIRFPAMPALKRLLFIGGSAAGFMGLDELTALGRNISDEDFAARKASVGPEDLAMIQFTSGTSGKPKGVMLSHGVMSQNAWNGAANQFLTEKDRVLLPVPLFHCLGVVVGAMESTGRGSAMVLVETFSPGRVLSNVESEHCTSLYGVPAMFRALVNSRARKHYDLSSLRTGVVAGAICPADIATRCVEELHMPEFHNAYGLTEAAPMITHTNRDDSVETRANSVGRVIKGVELAIINPADGRHMGPGESGEICSRGNVMMGYLDDPEATAAAIDSEGWLHTGDRGWVDETGSLFLNGRIKDLIIRYGENISPREVEDCLTTYPGIKDAAAVGLPSEACGEEVCAFLLVEDNQTLISDAVRQYCRERLSSFKVPRYLAVLEEFPRTSSGKVRMNVLRDLAKACFANVSTHQGSAVLMCNPADYGL